MVYPYEAYGEYCMHNAREIRDDRFDDRRREAMSDEPVNLKCENNSRVQMAQRFQALSALTARVSSGSVRQSG